MIETSTIWQRLRRGLFVGLGTAACSAFSVFLAIAGGLNRSALIVGLSIIVIAAIVIGSSGWVDYSLLWRPRLKRAIVNALWTEFACLVMFPLRMGCDFVSAGVLAEILLGPVDEFLPFYEGAGQFGPALIAVLLRGALFALEFCLWTILWAALGRDERLPPGPPLCEKCGYDLRGSLEFGRCPECGTPMESASAAGIDPNS